MKKHVAVTISIVLLSTGFAIQLPKEPVGPPNIGVGIGAGTLGFGS